MKKFFFLFFVLTSINLFSQGEAANWYFGFGAGMEFDQATGNINVVNNGQLSTNEGCSSISDSNGNLLFYSDGTTVWNRNHVIMQNGTGLLGDSSSTQSAIIVPKPNDNNIYYIFTVDNFVDGNMNGFHYYEVDMTLDGGLGAIIGSTKLLDACSEKISAVLKDCITKSIWVITFSSTDGQLVQGQNPPFNTFHAFEVTDTGVNTTSVVSQFSLNITDARGYLKLSPDGTKLANANMRDGLFIYDFDVATGIVSNEQPLTINSQSNRSYGVEFSPNNQFLYIHSSNDYFNQQDPSQNNIPANHNSTLTQFDLTAVNVQTSEFTLDERQLYRGGLQLGPDGKIYRALSATYFTGLPALGIINNPNILGTGSNYQHNAIDLSPNNSSQGLPPFIQSLFNQQIDIIQNGVSTLNLDLCEGDIYTLVADDIPGVTYTWSMDGSPLAESDFDLVINQTGHYEVFIDPNNGDCAIEGQAFVSYYQIPVANQPNDLIVCDDNNDDSWSFDFTTQDADVIGMQDSTVFNVNYFETQEDADNNENVLVGNYTNTSNPQTIFVRIDNIGNADCFDTTSFDIVIFNTPIANTIEDFVLCDDDLDGDNMNGQREFDLESLNATILSGQDETEYAITYHNSQAEADTNSNAIASPYYNNIANQEEIFIRIENVTNTDCYDTTSVTLIVNILPEAINSILVQCDEDGIPEGYSLFNLTEVIEDITNGATNVTTHFYAELGEAENSENEIDANSFSNWENPQTVYAQVVDNTTGCFNIAELSLQISITNANDASLETCDDDGTEDGFHSFNLLDAEPEILNGLPPDLVVSFYEEYEDALLEINAISTIYTNTEAYNQTIYVRVETMNACYGINEIELTVYKLPNLEPDGQELYCLNSFPESIKLFGGVINDSSSHYYYDWSTGEDTSEIQVNEPGTYTVTVTSVVGCSKTRSISVLPSNIATINNIEVVDAIENNALTIFVSGEGEYEYALNNINGPYFENNFIENVIPGIHTVYVRDIKNDCGIVEELVSVIGFPKFLTPNSDSFNDTWKIYGVNAMFQPNTFVYIFNRHGKLITQLDPLGPGWNGTLNGQLLPANDYWFAVTLQDGRVYKGHFSLKR